MNDTDVVKFITYGKAQSRGSKNVGVRYGKDGEPIKTKTGRILTFAKDDNEKSTNWMQQVSSAAAQVFRGQTLLQGPLNLSAKFYFVRPGSHYFKRISGTVLRGDAPEWHESTPDLSKLIRGIEDAITGVVWVDDRQVVSFEGSWKKWTETQARVEIEISHIKHYLATTRLAELESTVRSFLNAPHHDHLAERLGDGELEAVEKMKSMFTRNDLLFY